MVVAAGRGSACSPTATCRSPRRARGRSTMARRGSSATAPALHLARRLAESREPHANDRLRGTPTRPPRPRASRPQTIKSCAWLRPVAFFPPTRASATAPAPSPSAPTPPADPPQAEWPTADGFLPNAPAAWNSVVLRGIAGFFFRARLKPPVDSGASRIPSAPRRQERPRSRNNGPMPSALGAPWHCSALLGR